MNYVVRKLTGNLTRWPSAKTLIPPHIQSVKF
jgi:hypothetical protein